MADLPETKRMRTEHLRDKGAASDDNPRTHATEDMPPDVYQKYEAARRAMDQGDTSLARAFDTQYPDYRFDSSEEDATDARNAADFDKPQPFAATTQKPGAQFQPPTVTPSVQGTADKDAAAKGKDVK